MTEDKTTSALVKRAEQMKRWEESDTNRHSPQPKPPARVRFSSGIVFLAACAAGDKEEVQRLLDMGTDINTVNIDGLTALHQACIDDNLEMVEFLVTNGADINRGDNEGWTPLHATSSCGFLSIARYLLDNNANVASVNCDGQLPIDIAESDDMIKLLQKAIKERGVDCSQHRNAELNMLLEHAREWAIVGYDETRDVRTGGTPLHVAAAKGYYTVAKILLENCQVDPNLVDNDGWSPLHAAAVWGHKNTATLLLSHGADPHLKNYAGQTCIDVVMDSSMSAWLQEEIAKVPRIVKNNISHKRKLSPPLHDVKRVDVEIHRTEEPTERNDDTSSAPETTTRPEQDRPPAGRARAPNKSEINDENTNNEGGPSWRRPSSFKSRRRESTNDPRANSISVPEITLKRAQSFQSDNSFYQRYRDVTARIKASSCSSIPPLPQSTLAEIELRKKSRESNNATEITNEDKQTRENKPPESENKEVQKVPTTATPCPDRFQPAERNDKEDDAKISTNSQSTPSPASPNNNIQKVPLWSSENVDTNSNNTTSSTTTPTKLSPGNIFKNFFKTFGYPVRDEESETQRKAHAKRVRETRRSTQGVTLEDVRSAEQLIKKKTANGIADSSSSLSDSKKTPATSTYNHSDNSSFELEDSNPATRRSVTIEPTISYQYRRPTATTVNTSTANTSTANTSTANTSAAATSAGTTSSVTNCSNDNPATGGEDKDVNVDPKQPSASLTMIQRRRRPKRRSTGVGRVEIEEAVNNDSTANDDVDAEPTEPSGGEGESTADVDDNDYKILYQASLKEIRRIDALLAASQQQLREAHSTIAHLRATTDGTLSESEKREKRAMERKLSEMEEELKQLQKLKAENERLRAENRALTRVVSKLTNSAAK